MEQGSATVGESLNETWGQVAGAHALLGDLNGVGDAAVFPRHRADIEDSIAGVGVAI